MTQCCAFLLKKIPYRESSMILSLWTQEYGRIHAVLRLGRSQQYTNIMELFRCYNVQLRLGKHFDLTHLSSLIAEKQNHLFSIGEYSLQQSYPLQKSGLWLGFYLNELLLRLMPITQVESKLFEIYRRTLSLLVLSTEMSAETEYGLRLFELHVLDALGILPNFECDECGRPLTQAAYFLTHTGLYSYQPVDDYGVLANLMLSADFLRTLQNLMVQSEVADTATLLQLKHVMRFLIAPLLKGKPLKSRLWFQKLQQQSQRDSKIALH